MSVRASKRPWRRCIKSPVSGRSEEAYRNMKRQIFRLGSVLKHYEIQKQRAEQELHHASRILRETDDEIATLHKEIEELAQFLGSVVGTSLTAAGWIASCRRSEHLGQMLAAARIRRDRQAEV